MRERHIGFKRAINEAIRAGVGPPDSGRGPGSATPTFKMGFAPDANLDKALALAARLEDDDQARTLAGQK